MAKFRQLRCPAVRHPTQLVFALDHNVQDTSAANRAKYADIAAFARAHGVDAYAAGRGIGHQIMVEELYAWPGTLAVASDSHSNMYGGLGCLGTPVVRTDAVAIWATGTTWWQVPPVARVRLTGALRPGVTSKDVVIALCGAFHDDQVLNHAVEFCGDAVAQLSVADRLTIANMTTEWGAVAAVFPVDAVTLAWLQARCVLLRHRAHDVPEQPQHQHQQQQQRARMLARCAPERLVQLADAPLAADPDAHYDRDLTLDLASLVPHVSGPDHVKRARPLAELERQRVRIHKAYLVSCVNSRTDDLAQAAAVLRDRRVADGVALYVAAASSEVEAESRRRGDWPALLAAGAQPLPAGCGPCIGLGAGLLQDHEVGISATNRNFKGRMGSRLATTYLASPAVVAASAVAGYICGPDVLAGRPTAAPPPGGLVYSTIAAPAGRPAGRSRV